MYKKGIKRLLDLVLCMVGLPVFLLLLFILGPIIYCTDRGPIFYNAPRVGRNGKLFRMYKFRSMYVNAPDLRNADGTTFNSEEDPRVTPIGRFMRKTSLDEIPQFLNVLRGDMSLIGPRPDLPDALDTVYTDEIRKKLLVHPGITGYSQAYYRNEADLETRFRQDVFYAEHLTFGIDVKIFFKTIAMVLGRKGIYRNKSEEGMETDVETAERR